MAGAVQDGSSGFNQGPRLATAIYVMYAIAVGVAFLRLTIRANILHSFGLDDWFMLVTVLFSTALTVTVPFQVRTGAGIHQWELAKTQVSLLHKTAWLEQVFYLPALWAVKMSICGLYMRLVSVENHRYVLYGVMAVITSHSIAATVGNICLCTPQRIIWDVDRFPVGCIDILSFNYFNAAFMIFEDIVLVLLPIPLLQRLHISRRKKYGLMGVFAVGLMAITVTIARLVYTVRWGNSPLDFSGTWMPVALCTALEIDIAMICACLPALNVLLKKLTGGDSYGSGLPDSGYELRGSGTGGTGKTGNSQRKGKGSRYNSKIFTSATNITVGGDNESEEQIFQPDDRDRERGGGSGLSTVHSPGKISKTVEYTVDLN